MISKYGKILDLDTIRQLMKDRKVTQVARKTGLNPMTIHRILWGKSKPNYETLRLLSEYLTATPDQILARNSAQNGQEA